MSNESSGTGTAVAERPGSKIDALACLARNIIIARAHARISQGVLAQAAGVSRPTISTIERASGSVSVGTVSRIARALGTTVAALFTENASSRDGDLEPIIRAKRARADAVDAHDLIRAIEEASDETDVETERYSHAGRPAAVTYAVRARAASAAPARAVSQA